MKSVQDIIDEVRIRTDASNIEDGELILYIDELDDFMGHSVFAKLESNDVSLSDGVYSYDVSDITETERIEKVLIDGKRITKKSSPDDLLEGWYFQGVKVFLSPSLTADHSTMTIIYQPKNTPHNISDTNLFVPEQYHELYVYHCLAQIAAKEGDEVNYNNYQNDYNGLLSEVLSVVTGRQVAPRFRK